MACLFAVRGKRQREQIRRRVHRVMKDRREDFLGHRFLIARYRQPAFGDVKRSLRRSPVAPGVVQNAIANPVAVEQIAGKLIAVFRQRKLLRQTVPMQHERVIG